MKNTYEKLYTCRFVSKIILFQEALQFQKAITLFIVNILLLG
jgi:hypothetical protein